MEDDKGRLGTNSQLPGSESVWGEVHETAGKQKVVIMYVFLIIVVLCIGAMAWVWHSKPRLKGMPARTWPVTHGKALPRRKFIVPFK
jgi:hypothetical protein